MRSWVFYFLNLIKISGAKDSIYELIKVGFFIGFLPVLVAILFDLGYFKIFFKELSINNNFKITDALISTLIPNNYIFLSFLSAYVILDIIFMFLLYILNDINSDKSKIFFKTSLFLKPMADVLYQLIAIIVGVFFALGLLSMFFLSPLGVLIFALKPLFSVFFLVVVYSLRNIIIYKYKMNIKCN